MVRYHGVLAANAAARAEVVPGRAPVADEQLALFTPADGGPLQPPPPTRHPWAWLLRRVFAVEMTQCPTCAGRMRLLDVVTDPDDIARALVSACASSEPHPRGRRARRRSVDDRTRVKLLGRPQPSPNVTRAAVRVRSTPRSRTRRSLRARTTTGPAWIKPRGARRDDAARRPSETRSLRHHGQTRRHVAWANPSPATDGSAPWRSM